MELEFSTERLLGIMESWQEDARKVVDDIADWRDREGLNSRDWPEDRTTWLYLGTAEIVGWVSANHPLLNAQPLLTVHEYAQKWHADGHAKRLPPQPVIDSVWYAADLLVFSQRCGLAPCKSATKPEALKRWPREGTQGDRILKLAKKDKLDRSAIADRVGCSVDVVSAEISRHAHLLNGKTNIE